MNTQLSNAKEIRIPGPDHPITISPAKGKVRVTVAGRIVAESSRALRLEEKGHSPVYYFLRNSADMSLLVRTEHSTYCPYKGDCAYYSIPIGGVFLRGGEQHRARNEREELSRRRDGEHLQAPSLGDGSALQEGDLLMLCSQLRGALPIEFLPSNVLVRSEDSITWWTPAAVRAMFYAKEQSSEVALLSGKRFSQPPLVFRARKRLLEVRALLRDERPNPQTVLYRAPYWNVNEPRRCVSGNGTGASTGDCRFAAEVGERVL